MRRIITTIAGAGLALGLLAGPAAAFQPPGHGAADNFGCVNGEDNPVAGHPGANGIVDAATRVRDLTGNQFPTAWNAVDRAEPIDFGEC